MPFWIKLSESCSHKAEEGSHKDERAAIKAEEGSHKGERAAIKAAPTNIMKPLTNRRSIRLPNFDYSRPGMYYITICLHKRKCLFGNIIDGEMILNDFGLIVQKRWLEIPMQFSHTNLDELIVMPNHIHGIIEILAVGAAFMAALPAFMAALPGFMAALPGYEPACMDTDKMVCTRSKRAGTRPAPTLGDIVGSFKSLTTNEYIKGVKTKIFDPFQKPLWQRNYYEHVIRDEDDLNRIREYIHTNPDNWKKDELYIA